MGFENRLSRIVRAFVAVALSALATVVLVAGAAASRDAGPSASTLLASPSCTNSWTNPAGGSWTTGGNWSLGTPPSTTDDVCVTLAGTYNVVLSLPLLVHSLAIGGVSGVQTLTIGSTCSANAGLTTTIGTTVNATGLVDLTNGDVCAFDAMLAGPITNAGVIQTDHSSGGGRVIQGNLTNTGRLTINANTAFSGMSSASPSTLDNQGTIAVGDGFILTVSSFGSLTNTSGTIGGTTSTGSGLIREVGGTLTELAGTTVGVLPVTLDDGSLVYAGAGASSFAINGAGFFSGNLAAGQSLAVESTCTENTTATAAASFTNAGTITLTNGDTCPDVASLVTTAGSLSNVGTIQTLAAVGGVRSIQGNLTNSGQLNVNANTGFSGFSSAIPSILDNRGTLAVANGSTLALTNFGSLTNTSGTIGGVTSTGTGLIRQVGGILTEGAGTTTGALPVVLDDGNLVYTGTGASSIVVNGTDNLSGNLASGQALLIESTCTENETTTAGASFTNAGTIIMNNGDTCADNVTLDVGAGTLTNSGTLQSIAAVGGARTFHGSLTNTGTVAIDQTTTLRGAGPIVNQGIITFASGKLLIAKGRATITNGAGGQINASSGTGPGGLVQTTGFFNQSGGTTSGAEPVVLDRVALNYTAGGASTIGLRGTSGLTGNLQAGQVLRIESTCTENAVTTAPHGFSNAGTILLTNGDSCVDNATLTLTGVGTLTNTGTLESLEPHGGTRSLNGNLSNAKTLILDAGTNLLLAGTYTQTSAGTINPTISGATTFGDLTATGAATLGGLVGPNLVGAFHPTAGAIFTFIHAPAITGTFAGVTKGNINGTGLYFDPLYSSTTASLVVTQATASVPSVATKGSSIAISGTMWFPNDSIQVEFTDFAGVTTFYPTITAAANGSFSVNETIPSTASSGKGKLIVTSLLTGATITNTVMIS